MAFQPMVGLWSFELHTCTRSEKKRFGAESPHLSALGQIAYHVPYSEFFNAQKAPVVMTGARRRLHDPARSIGMQSQADSASARIRDFWCASRRLAAVYRGSSARSSPEGREDAQ